MTLWKREKRRDVGRQNWGEIMHIFVSEGVHTGRVIGAAFCTNVQGGKWQNSVHAVVLQSSNGLPYFSGLVLSVAWHENNCAILFLLYLLNCFVNVAWTDQCRVISSTVSCCRFSEEYSDCEYRRLRNVLSRRSHWTRTPSGLDFTTVLLRHCVGATSALVTPS